MIIKSKDDIRIAVEAIEELLARKNHSKKQRSVLEEEMTRLVTGTDAENEGARYIDLKLKDSKDWAVIHDLRIEHHGRVALIDHLLISRRFDLLVIDSKHFAAQVRVDAGGEFQVRARAGWKKITSPVEQNKRQIIVLNELINDHKLSPMRLGLPMRPAFRNWILVSAECEVTVRNIEEANILKMDAFDSRLAKLMSHSTAAADVLTVTKLCSTHTIVEFARSLVRFHRPASCDYAARFGVPLPAASAPSGPAARPVSQKN